MRMGIRALQEKRLVDRLRSLKVKGEVIEKKRIESLSSRPERKVVLVRLKNRTMETDLEDGQWERSEVGDQIWVSPPVPDRDPCNCHLFLWLIAAISTGALLIWGISIYFHGRTAAVLSLVASGWISVIAWARICTHEQNKYLRKLEMEIDFFLTDRAHEKGDQE
ncbi:MAG: hypothetical protein C4576_28525 [Desulfobacteraceae bacterium]|nr:MAG: hypothetical protein C4576_28525 [Desulfobacteraceae bacterium]